MQELREEIKNFVEIAFDDVGFEHMFINFPKYKMKDLQELIDQIQQQDSLKMMYDLRQMEQLEHTLVANLEPLFDEEYAFYGLLADILQQSLLGQKLDDSQRQLFSRDHPFPPSEEEIEE